MFALRRAAARALASPVLSTPIRSQTQTQSARSYSTIFSKCQQSPYALPSALSWQRRWASNDSTDPAETRAEPAADGEVEHVESRAAGTGASIGEAVEQAAERTQQAIEDSNAPEAVKNAAATATGALLPDRPTAFIGNLYFHVTEDALRAEFEKYGTVRDLKIGKDARGMSRGFGWIEFEDDATLRKAIEGSHNTQFEGRIIFVSESDKPMSRRQQFTRSNDLRTRAPKNEPSRTLWIGNMSYDMTDQDLNNLFRPLQNVLDVRVAIDRRTGQARGFAHADFVDVASAVKALEQLEAQTVYGRKLKLDYAKSFVATRNPGSQAEA